MGHKPPRRNSARLGAGLAVWILAAGLAQGLLGGLAGRKGPDLERQLELKGVAPQTKPERAHEPDALEPWELVRV